MADQDGKMHGTTNPPFATSSGSAQGQGDTSSGAHDFIADNSSPTGQGPGYLLHDRPQSEADGGVEPNPQEIPSSGLLPDAAPGAASSQLGAAGGVQGVSQTPFKGLR